LARWFSPVILHRYDDALLVTEAAPLIAYVLSGLPAEVAAAQTDQLAAFAQSVMEMCVVDGAVRISKFSGMFEAIRP
jgi:hypothetical protein